MTNPWETGINLADILAKTKNLCYNKDTKKEEGIFL